MKSAVIIFAIAVLLCLILENESKDFDGVVVRSDIYDEKPAFFKIAKSTYDQSRLKHFVEVTPETRFPYKMKLYCYPKDPRFCVFYDYFGNIAGVQISFLKADVQSVDPNLYNYTAVRDFVHTSIFRMPAYSVRVYFTRPDKLTEAGRQNISEVAEGLWTFIDGKLIQIPRCKPNGPRGGTFKLQGCYPRKGTVFVNKFGLYDSCKEAYPIYALYERNSLVGFGFFGIGYGTPGPLRDWYTHATGKPLKDLLPAPPTCLEDLRKFNFTSIHVFLIDTPWRITCSKCSV